MKKKLLALAVAGAFVTPVAMADSGNVTIYGQMNASVVFGDTDDQKAGTAPLQSGTTSTRISSDQSRIGFKGTEDLGGGTSAIWQVEQGINVDAGTWGSASRNTFVGLAGESWGDIKLGHMDSPYKSSTRGLDVFPDTIADNRSVMGIVSVGGNAATVASSTATLDARNNNSLTYTSPDLSGFKVSAQYAAVAEGVTTAPNNKGSNYSLSLGYNAGPITAAAAMVQMKNGNGNTSATNAGAFPVTAGLVTVDDKVRGLRFGGGYKMDAVTVNAVFERIEGDITTATGRTDNIRTNTFYVGGKFALSGSDAVKVAYTRRGDVGEGANKAAQSKISQMSLGYDHAMSKRTSVYALYTRLANDDKSKQGIMNASNDTVTGLQGANPSAFALGVKHSF